MNEAIDLSALNWVQQELGETLKQGRLFLEEYAEGNRDVGNLSHCMACLQEARGPLRIVELSGADLLAAEMEEVLNDLLHDRPGNIDVAMQVLMQSFIQLSDYLFSLRSSRCESAAMLLPIINELRTLRGVTLMAESRAFTPDLLPDLPLTAYDPQQAATLPGAAQLNSLRQRFQAGLIEWYRDTANVAGLQVIIVVADSLRQASHLQNAARFWWVTGGFAEVLLADPQAATSETKQLLGQIDQQIKCLIDAGEDGFAGQIPATLVENLLHYIAASAVVTGQAGEVRRVLMQETRSTGGGPDNAPLAGRNTEVLNTVTTAIMDDLEQIREQLERYLRNENAAGDLSPVVDDLHALANMLEISSIDDAAGVIRTVISQCRELAPGMEAETGDVLAGIATSLVGVEASIRDMRTRELTQESDSSTASLVWNEGLAAVINAVVVDMAAVKEHIHSYLQAPQSPSGLASVPGLLQQIRGGLQLAGQDRAATLVEQVGDYVDTALLRSEQLPDAGQLDKLADAICSIEYFVEELGENRVHGSMVLDIAEQSLSMLGAGTDEEPAAHSDDDSVPCEPSAVAAPVVDVPVISGLQVLADDTDPEIFEIFIEEVEEELARLSRLIPGWVSDTENREMIETICRIFHTLKGGGRMVGALALAEFSWAFEHLLNQVVENRISVDAKLFELVLETSEPLAQLLEQVKSGTAPEADVDSLVARAMAMVTPVVPVDSSGPPASLKVPAVEVAEIAESEVTDEPESGALEFSADDLHESDVLPVLTEEADPEIVEIFMEEAAEIMEVISAQWPLWVNDQDHHEALGELRRCFHTLKGSGRMAGAMRVGEFSWTIENLLNRVIDGTVPADTTLVAVIDRVPVFLSELVAQVNGGPPPNPEYRALVHAAEQLARGEQPDIPVIAEGQPAVVDTDDPAVAEYGEEPLAVDGDEPDIIDIFRRESADHLKAIQTFIGEWRAGDTDCSVSEPLYRALHTLSGITESAGLPDMHSLAFALYGHFDELYEQQLPVREPALGVLDNCRAVLGDLIERLPAQECDAGWLHTLLAEIESLSVETSAVDADRQGEPETGAMSVEVQDVPEMDGSETGTAGQQASDAANDAIAMQVPPPEELPASAGAFSGMDPELLEVFIEEATDIIDNSESTLRAWQDDRDNRELLNEFQRQLHTLKGGARMTGIAAIGDLSHGVESLLTRLVDGHITVTDRLFDDLHAACDALALMLDKVKENAMPVAAPQLEQMLDEFTDEPVIPEAGVVESGKPVDVIETAELPESEHTDAAGTGPVAEPEPEPVETMVGVPATIAVVESTGATDQPESMQEGEIMPRRAERRKASRVRTDQVRIQADLLDNLVNYAGEISIYRSRLEQQFGLYRFNIDELQQTVSRLGDQLRQMEIETETQILFRHEQEAGNSHAGFDPLELDRYSNLQQLSRSLMESIGYLESIREMMDSTTRDSETLLLQQSRVTTDLQDGLLRTRMIPFASLAPRLRRIVRQAAGELGKRVELQLDGADGEMDRTVVERIIAPLEHLLRNAVDHGIEKPAGRKRNGKPRSGSIRISLHREGSEIVLRIADDGRGIDHQAIREKAVERGMVSEEAAPSGDEVMQFILQSGFSTAREVTQISGRGVGLDVVNSEIHQLGGSLYIESEAGKGSVFTMRLPYTLAINQALLVHAGDENFCIPLGGIEGVVRIARDDLSVCYAQQDPAYAYAGNSYQLRHLGTLLGTGGMDADNTSARLPVLLVRSGEKRIALQVEALHGNREIVVKPLGVQLGSVNGISGATILGDGRVVLILDLAAVVRMEPGQPVIGDVSGPGRSNKLTVMVVDDSITVRKVTTRLLQRNGFEVVTAKDGVDAMGRLQDCVPDMMLLDIEMPRMDGFELAMHMRNDARFRHIPITMITSRTGNKHRERAREIGVDQYLGKPYQEHELLDTIHRLIGISTQGQAGDQEQADD